MLYIRCTKKLFDQLSRYGHTLDSEPGDIHVLKEWYANLFYIERRKCCLFTHSPTLFSFLVLGLKKSAFIDFATTFRENLHLTLQSEGIQGSFIDQITAQGSGLGVLKTNNRSILGSMNELIFLCTVYIESDGGLANCNVLEINHTLNRTPMGALKYGRPIQAFTNILTGLSPDIC